MIPKNHKQKRNRINKSQFYDIKILISQRLYTHNPKHIKKKKRIIISQYIT
jgi:hypothetical protein